MEHLNPKNIELAKEVSKPDLPQVHHLKANSVESFTEISEPNLSVLIEKIQLTDKVSNAEKKQMLQWIKERFEEIQESVRNVDEILTIARDELSKILSSDAVQVLIEILQNFLGL